MQAEQFSYCQPWMLAWGYRKQNLLKELLNYDADIMCLQVRGQAALHAAMRAADLNRTLHCMHSRLGTVHATFCVPAVACPSSIA